MTNIDQRAHELALLQPITKKKPGLMDDENF